MISTNKVLGGVLAENTVALEDGDSLLASVGNLNLSNMAGGASELNGERAASSGQSGQSSDGDDLGKHVDGVRRRLLGSSC